MAAAKKTARKSVKDVEPAATEMFATVEAAANGAREQLETLFAAFSDNAEALRDQTEELFETMRSNFESTQSHFKAINADFVEDVRKQMAETVEYMNSLANVTSPTDALELHRDYWTGQYDAQVERANTLTKASVEAAREAFEPYSKSLTTLAANANFEKLFSFSPEKFFSFAAK